MVILVREGWVVDALSDLMKDDTDVGLVVMGRKGKAPGAFAYELLRHGRAVVTMVP
jgi:hypothetical protein